MTGQEFCREGGARLVVGVLPGNMGGICYPKNTWLSPAARFHQRELEAGKTGHWHTQYADVLASRKLA